MNLPPGGVRSSFFIIFYRFVETPDVRKTERSETMVKSVIVHGINLILRSSLITIRYEKQNDPA